MIIESGNDYVIGVKQNQPKLYKQIEKNMSDEKNIHSKYSQLELNKGRLERRETLVSNNLQGISSEWGGLKEIIKVNRMIKRKGEISKETAYFISSKEYTANNYAYRIRGHWGIENGLHWVKDVTFKEDASKIQCNQAPQNMSVFRNFSINIFRHNGYNNMAEAIRLVSNDIYQLCKLLI